MNVIQAYPIANAVYKMITGQDPVIAEDLHDWNIAGEQISAITGWMDNYTKGLFDLVGETIFVNRPYEGRTPGLMKKGSEYGSIIRKINAEVGDFTQNESWNLQSGAVYEQDRFSPPKVEYKLFNQRFTYELENSIAEDQVKESLRGPSELVQFLSMIETMIRNKDTKTADGMMMLAVNNFIGETIYDQFQGANPNSGSGVRAVNLRYLYNNDNGTSLTFPDCLRDKDFLRYATQKIKLYAGRMRDYSVAFNIGGKERHTPASHLKTIFLDEFTSAAGTYLLNANGQFLVDNLKLPNAETVSYWQGSGTDYDISSTSAIDITTSENHSISLSGILGVMFDDEAAFIANLDRHTRAHINDRAEFVNYWYKTTFGVCNDFNENFVVFYAA